MLLRKINTFIKYFIYTHVDTNTLYEKASLNYCLENETSVIFALCSESPT
jgi:hypothetical protein